MFRLAAWLVLAVHTTWIVFLVAGFPRGVDTEPSGCYTWAAWAYGLIRSPLRK